MYREDNHASASAAQLIINKSSPFNQQTVNDNAQSLYQSSSSSSSVPSKPLDSDKSRPSRPAAPPPFINRTQSVEGRPSNTAMQPSTYNSSSTDWTTSMNHVDSSEQFASGSSSTQRETEISSYSVRDNDANSLVSSASNTGGSAYCSVCGDVRLGDYNRGVCVDCRRDICFSCRSVASHQV